MKVKIFSFISGGTQKAAEVAINEFLKREDLKVCHITQSSTSKGSGDPSYTTISIFYEDAPGVLE